MINWEDYKFNEELSLQIIDDELTFKLKVKIIEYEWSLHRHPFLADIQIVESDNHEVYPLNSIMRLPLETKETFTFLLFAPNEKEPNRAKIYLGKLFHTQNIQ